VLYRNYPPQPDLPQPYHLLPSAAAAAEKAKTASNESTESSRPNERRAQANNSSGSSVEWSDDAPLIPQRCREMQKRKAGAADLAR
jgi:hypothetical protein